MGSWLCACLRFLNNMTNFQQHAELDPTDRDSDHSFRSTASLGNTVDADEHCAWHTAPPIQLQCTAQADGSALARSRAARGDQLLFAGQHYRTQLHAGCAGSKPAQAGQTICKQLSTRSRRLVCSRRDQARQSAAVALECASRGQTASTRACKRMRAR
jgi:hypothetical protein